MLASNPQEALNIFATLLGWLTMVVGGLGVAAYVAWWGVDMAMSRLTLTTLFLRWVASYYRERRARAMRRP